MKAKFKNDHGGFELAVLVRPTEIEVVLSGRPNQATYVYVCVVEDDKNFVLSDNHIQEVISLSDGCCIDGIEYDILSTDSEGNYYSDIDRNQKGKVILQLKKIEETK